jgi:hypothetical protein
MAPNAKPTPGVARRRGAEAIGDLAELAAVSHGNAPERAASARAGPAAASAAERVSAG